MESLKTCEATPLFDVGFPHMRGVNFETIFSNWPKGREPFMNRLNAAHAQLMSHMKDDDCQVDVLIADIDAYLPLLVALENEKNADKSLKATPNQFYWEQSPIISGGWKQRLFTAEYISVEIFHVLWLRAMVLMKQGSLYNEEDRFGEAAMSYRFAAGIFHFLASDRLLEPDDKIPYEFSGPALNSMMSLCLAHAYSVLAKKGEDEGVPRITLAKLAYGISSTFMASLEAANKTTPEKLFHKKYKLWVESLKVFWHAVSAINLAIVNKEKGHIGKAISFIRLAIADLNSIPKQEKPNQTVNEAAGSLLQKIMPLDRSWTNENFELQSQYVPTTQESELVISTSCLTTGLAQPKQYKLPEPALFV